MFGSQGRELTFTFATRGGLRPVVEKDKAALSEHDFVTVVQNRPVRFTVVDKSAVAGSQIVENVFAVFTHDDSMNPGNPAMGQLHRVGRHPTDGCLFGRQQNRFGTVFGRQWHQSGR